ncbi:MAG TPA: MarC family protein [Blastocatellia bacterium]|nr:MarC family protein [Blastocatellia bacterium]
MAARREGLRARRGVGQFSTARAAGAIILLSSTLLYNILKERGLIALERLMGMLLVMIAVQMFKNGVAKFLTPSS